MNHKENSAMFEQTRAIRSDQGPANTPPPRETVMAVIEQVIAHQCAAYALVVRIESAIGMPGEPPGAAGVEKSAGIGQVAMTARSQAILLNERLVRIADALA